MPDVVRGRRPCRCASAPFNTTHHMRPLSYSHPSTPIPVRTLSDHRYAAARDSTLHAPVNTAKPHTCTCTCTAGHGGAAGGAAGADQRAGGRGQAQDHHPAPPPQHVRRRLSERGGERAVSVWVLVGAGCSRSCGLAAQQQMLVDGVRCRLRTRQALAGPRGTEASNLRWAGRWAGRGQDVRRRATLRASRSACCCGEWWRHVPYGRVRNCVAWGDDAAAIAALTTRAGCCVDSSWLQLTPSLLLFAPVVRWVYWHTGNLTRQASAGPHCARSLGTERNL